MLGLDERGDVETCGNHCVADSAEAEVVLETKGLAGRPWGKNLAI